MERTMFLAHCWTLLVQGVDGELAREVGGSGKDREWRKQADTIHCQARTATNNPNNVARLKAESSL